jgi:hypothetical protein
MATNFHHLESASNYADLNPESVVNIGNMGSDDLNDNEIFNVATPHYDYPTPPLKQMMYGGLINPQIYDGNVDPQQWIDEYNYVADANMWNEDVKFKRLISCLEGAPRIWFFNERRRNPRFDWQQFREGLVQKFTNTCDKFMVQTRIMRRVQQKDENFNIYWESKLQLIEMYAPTMLESDKLAHLINGLEENLQKRVLQKYLSGRPQTVMELYNLIKVTSDAYNYTSSKFDSDKKNRSIDSTEPAEISQRVERSQPKRDGYRNRQGERVDKLIKTLEGLTTKISQQQKGRSNWNPRRNRYNNPQYQNQRNKEEGNDKTRQDTNPQMNTNQDLSQVICYSCGKRGHYSRNCSNKQTLCYYCGTRGHYADSCPNKQTSTEPKNSEVQN